MTMETGTEFKVYVAVAVYFNEEGVMLPRALTWEDGHTYQIDRVVDIRPAYAAKAGGQGDRYTVMMRGQRRFLFFERTTNLTGNIMAFMAAMFMGLYFAMGDEVRKRVDGSLYVLMVFASCWVCFTIGAVASGTPLLGYRPLDYALLVVMAFVCQIGSHAVFNMCIGHVSSLYVSTWETGDAVFATILAVIFLGQIPQIYEIIGCVVVVGALLYYNRQEIKNQA